MKNFFKPNIYKISITILLLFFCLIAAAYLLSPMLRTCDCVDDGCSNCRLNTTGRIILVFFLNPGLILFGIDDFTIILLFSVFYYYLITCLILFIIQKSKIKIPTGNLSNTSKKLIWTLLMTIIFAVLFLSFILPFYLDRNKKNRIGPGPIGIVASKLCNEKKLIKKASDVSDNYLNYDSGERYVPEKISSLDQLPENIKSKVTSYLLDRLGKDYYSTIEFTSGNIVNFDELYRIKPNARNFKWQIPKYDLFFRLVDEENCIAEYNTNISLDESGNFIREIELPEVAKNPGKAKIISPLKAIELAKRQNLSPEEISISLMYSKQYDSLAWYINYYGDGGILCFSVDAHSGDIIDCPFWFGPMIN